MSSRLVEVTLRISDPRYGTFSNGIGESVTVETPAGIHTAIKHLTLNCRERLKSEYNYTDWVEEDRHERDQNRG